MRSTHVLSVLALSSTACMEIGLRPEAPGTDVLGESDDGGGGAQRDPMPEECNGVDDDLDGEIDEGFGDVDGDGIADCRDEDCDVELPDGGGVDLELTCTGWKLDVDDPWNLVVEWHWEGAPSVAMPVVINLTDDDGDGDVDAKDLPDVIVNSYATGDIVAFSAEDQRELWRAPGFRADAGIAAADIDADGQVEVVSITRTNRVRALNADGTEAWTSSDIFPMLYPVPTIADLDADGRPEVIADVGVVRGTDGGTVARLALDHTGPWRAPVVADLDGDGKSEILLGHQVFGHDGRHLWSAPLGPDALAAFAAVVQLDDDPQAEIAWAIGPKLHLFEHDGTLRSTSDISRRGRPGPLCAADIDGDGSAEVIVPASDHLVAFGADGRERWSARVRDSSGAAGCVTFDMDGDAVYEVVYADMEALYVFDGRTGAVRYENPAHGSVTYFETPVVADLDDDGSAEIVVASSGNGGYFGVTAFGHVEDGWPPAGPTWPVHDYYVTNVTDGGSVPVGGDPGWRTWSLFRGRPATAASGLPDLSVSILDDCIASCEPGGLLRMAVQVRNEGQKEIPAGHTLNLVGVEGKNRTTMRTKVLPAIPPETALPAFSMDLPWTSAPAGGLELVVDPANLLVECDEDDNVAKWSHGECP